MIPALIPALPFGRRRGAAPANQFALSVTPASRTIEQGASATFDIELTKLSGAAETATLTVLGLPEGVTGEFDDTTISTDGGTAELTLTVAEDAPAVDAARFRVRAGAPSQAKSRNALLTVVTAAALFFTYFRPGGVDTYLRPDGTGQYARP